MENWKTEKRYPYESRINYMQKHFKKTSQSLISANKSKLMPKCSNMMVMGYMSPIFPTKEVPFLKS